LAPWRPVVIPRSPGHRKARHVLVIVLVNRLFQVRVLREGRRGPPEAPGRGDSSRSWKGGECALQRPSFPENRRASNVFVSAVQGFTDRTATRSPQVEPRRANANLVRKSMPRGAPAQPSC